MRQSLSEENYLKEIHHLAQNGEAKVSLTALAGRLGVNAASAVDMVRKLSGKKLLTYDKARGVKLTTSGTRVALSIIRSHRLWEVFLLQHLKYSWDEVHGIAEQLEHVKDPALVDRLDEYLGRPDYDPHGDPIPKPDGRIPRIPKTTLADVAKGATCTVAGIKDTSPAYLQYLQRLRISIGTRLKVVERIEYDRSLVIETGKGTRTGVSRQFAESVLVD